MRARKLAETFVLKSRRTLRAMVGFRPRRRVIRLLRKGSAISNFDADASALDLPLIERTPVTLSGLEVGHLGSSAQCLQRVCMDASKSQPELFVRHVT